MTEETPARGKGRLWRRWVPLALLALVSVTVLASGATRFASLETLLEYRAALHEAVAANYPRAVAAAWAAYAGAVVLSIPVSVVMTMLCGLLFGTGVGALVAVSASTTGAVIVFSVGRGPGADLLRRRAGPRLSGFAAGFRRDAFGYVAVLRLLPVFPFWVTNLAPAIFGVPLRTFAAATFLGLLPGAFVYSATGAGIDEAVAAHQVALAACRATSTGPCAEELTLSHLLTPRILLGLGLIAVLAGLTLVLKRRA